MTYTVSWMEEARASPDLAPILTFLFSDCIIVFFVHRCECPQGKVCLRSDDDLSVSAYVYRCHVDTTERVDEEESQVS